MDRLAELPLRDAPASALAPDAPTIEARDVWRSFKRRPALRGTSLEVAPGEIHALLGRNGAGKTTLIRILAGLTTPDSGSVTVLGRDATKLNRELRGSVGLVPSGDRTFYLRLSGFENLLFFSRLHGLRKRTAAARAQQALESVGLADDADKRVGEYSHGMQKRLSVARALLTDPAVLLVDEATHDLDPHGARVVRELVRALANDGTGVLWATQRLDEIRGLAHRVTLLREGEVAFCGSVASLSSYVEVRRHVLQLRNGGSPVPSPRALQDVLADVGSIAAAEDGEHFVLRLKEGAVLGDALTMLSSAGVQVLACREERSELEEAFIHLTGRA